MITMGNYSKNILIEGIEISREPGVYPLNHVTPSLSASVSSLLIRTPIISDAL